MRGGKIVVTYDFDLATKYPTETHALEFLSSLNKSYNQKGYRPKKVEAKQLPPPEKQQLEPVRGEIAESEELTQLKNHLIMIDQILGSLKDLYSKKYNELTEASDSLEDISHAIEFINANAVQRCYLENEFKKARLKRRECKDMMTLIDLVSKFEPDDWGSNKLQKALAALDNRTYTPRIRRDLFEIKKGD
jgi:hypothetical protein